MNQNERRLWLIRALLAERAEYAQIEIPSETQGQRELLRALMNVRPPAPVSKEFLQIQDEYLQEEIREKGITRLEDLRPVQPGIYLWKGDITTLASDVIVNAANAQMLGCFHPNHKCIDNAIQTYAGIEMRNECARIMEKKGHPEPTGQAEITSAYNLPSKAVIHTVGPIVYGGLRRKDEEELATCYWNSLKLADAKGYRSIAFCCISTGEFHFPSQRAAEIAVETVRKYREQTGSSIEVIFNVFKDTDEAIYSELLKGNQPAEAGN